MPRALVGNRLVGLPRSLHKVGASGYRRANTGVVSAVETVHGSLNSGNVGLTSGSGPVEDIGCGQVGPVGGKTEGLAAAPAESPDGYFPIGSG